MGEYLVYCSANTYPFFLPLWTEVQPDSIWWIGHVIYLDQGDVCGGDMSKGLQRAFMLGLALLSFPASTGEHILDSQLAGPRE